MQGRGRSKIGISSAFVALLLLSGCKIVSIEEDRQTRERRSDDFDAAHYVAGMWGQRALPQLEKSAVPFAKLDTAIAEDAETAGAQFGRRAAEGSPWTFTTQGTGIVGTVNTASPEGTIELIVPTATGSRSVLLQTGPVIVDNSIRDALPFISFNDFSGQIAFADVGRSLTKRALTDTRATLGRLRSGDRVQFLGTFNLTEDGGQWRLTPVKLSTASAGTAG